MKNGLTAFEDALIEREKTRIEGRKYVLTNGCFDLLHAGHVDSLYNASKFGDSLWVALNSDRSIRRIKGKTRPIYSQAERAYMLSVLPWVRGVFLFETDRLTKEILALKPDIYVKSSDYTKEKMNEEERNALFEIEAEIKFVPLLPNISTTKTIARIMDACDNLNKR